MVYEKKETWRTQFQYLVGSTFSGFSSLSFFELSYEDNYVKCYVKINCV